MTSTLVDYPGYVFHEDGRIFSQRNNKFLVVFVHPLGYQILRLKHANGKIVNAKVHRLICTAFHGPPPSDQHTPDHINRIRADNRSSNLRWASKREQNLNAPSRVQTFNRRSRAVSQLDKATGAVIATYPSALAAARALLGSHVKSGKAGTIVHAMSGKQTSAYGFRWSAASKDIAVDHRDGEVWKRITDSRASVSNFGRVKSIRHTSMQGDKELLVHCPDQLPMAITNHVYKVMIPVAGAGRSFMVHRLVAEYFIDVVRQPGWRVRHEDNDLLNNHVSNLYYTDKCLKRISQAELLSHAKVPAVKSSSKRPREQQPSDTDESQDTRESENENESQNESDHDNERESSSDSESDSESDGESDSEDEAPAPKKKKRRLEPTTKDPDELFVAVFHQLKQLHAYTGLILEHAKKTAGDE